MTAPVEDIDRIMAVMSTAFDPAYGEAWTRRQVEDALLVGNCRYFLATRTCREASAGEESAGFSLSRTTVNEEELLLFAVDPNFRKQGIGQFILSSFIMSARSRGVERLVLEMRRDNQAESLYKRNGFHPVGIRKNYYHRTDGEWIDAITFECFVM